MSVSRDNISLLAEYNLLRLIREHGPVSQVRLSELSGYSRSTVSINCEKLLNSNLVVPDKDMSSSRKKNAELSINGDIGFVVGIGMGGSSCKITLFDVNVKILDSRSMPLDLAVGPEPILHTICQLIDEMLETAGKHLKRELLGIGIGLPTPVDYDKGVAYHPAFMPGWHLYPVKDYFNSRYGCHTFVDNEVNTMALAEFEEYKNAYNTLLCLKIGTGIGAGIIIDGNIYRGENGGGGNIGHIQIDEDTTPCECGKKGCIEAIASAPAIIDQAMEAAQSVKKGHLHELYKQREKEDASLTILDIKDAADQGDRLALQIIKRTGTILGSLVGKMIIFLDPGILIISGRLTSLGPNYLDYIRKAVYQQASPWIGPGFQVVYSKFGDESAAVGAALLCVQELFKHNYIADLGE